MKTHGLFTKIRENADRSSSFIGNAEALGAGASGERSLHIVWLYPDVLNLHGGRGDIMALLHAANLINLPVEIRRCDSFDEPIPFEWADMIFLNSGDLKCMPAVTKAIAGQTEQLRGFLDRKGMLVAISSSGAVLANGTELLDGSMEKGLGLLDMDWKQRDSVAGDDLWLSLPDGSEIIGNQIQMADVSLNEGQAAFGQVLYGRGNCGDGREGARTENVIYTAALGPILVKNPRLAAAWLKDAAAAAGMKIPAEIRAEDVVIEDESFDMIKNFIKDKMAGNI